MNQTETEGGNASQPFYPGDKVTTDFSKKMAGKTYTVQEVRRETNCDSGFMVSLVETDRSLDSNWLKKETLKPKSE